MRKGPLRWFFSDDRLPFSALDVYTFRSKRHLELTNVDFSYVLICLSVNIFLLFSREKQGSYLLQELLFGL